MISQSGHYITRPSVIATTMVDGGSVENTEGTSNQVRRAVSPRDNQLSNRAVGPKGENGSLSNHSTSRIPRS